MFLGSRVSSKLEGLCGSFCGGICCSEFLVHGVCFWMVLESGSCTGFGGFGVIAMVHLDLLGKWLHHGSLGLTI